MPKEGNKMLKSKLKKGKLCVKKIGPHPQHAQGVVFHLTVGCGPQIP